MKRPTTFGGAFVFLTVLFSLHCGTAPLCQPELPVGNLSTVNIVERWTAGGRYAYEAGIVGENLPSCAARDGLAGQSAITVTPNRSVSTAGDGGCSVTYGTFGAVAGVEVLGGASAGQGVRGEFFTGAVKAKMAGCVGTYVIGLAQVDRGSLRDIPGEAYLPNLIVIRNFFADEGSDATVCVSCRDAFVAYLE